MDFIDINITPFNEFDNKNDDEHQPNDSDKTPTTDPEVIMLKKESFVPVYGILKQYSDSPKRNDGTDKDPGERSSSKFYHTVKKLTRGDNYSHAIMSFDDKFDSMYSFEPEGIVRDDMVHRDSWLSTSSIYICVMFVRKSERDRMKKFVEHMVEHSGETKYSYMNLVRAYLGKPIKDDKRFICSTFVGYVLAFSNPKNLHRDFSRFRPEDITILPRSFYIGNYRDRNDLFDHMNQFKLKVKSQFEQFKDEIDDYNNHLPRLLLKHQYDSLKTLDKLVEWISTGATKKVKEKQAKEMGESSWISYDEAAEDLGLMYNGYVKLFNPVAALMNRCSEAIDVLTKNPNEAKINMVDDIAEFKKETDITIEPEEIEISDINKLRNTVIKFKSRLDKAMKEYAKLRNKIAYGGNYLRAVIKRPKVYNKEIDQEQYSTINYNIRTVYRAMDWIEKVLLDLYNMADHDLNVLNLVSRVYTKQHIYENTSTELTRDEQIMYDILFG